MGIARRRSGVISVVAMLLVGAIGLFAWYRLPDAIFAKEPARSLIVNCSFKDKERRMNQTFEIDASRQLISVQPGPFSTAGEVWPVIITERTITWTKEITVNSIARHTGELTYRVHGTWHETNWKCTTANLK